jgi:hypothetical protein
MVTIVSGLPRSGTSLMMQMLGAGGLPVLSDGLRAADENNPRGYYEWEKAKRLLQDPEVIAEAEGKAVKVISTLLFSLPAGRSYRVIFMLRDLAEVVRSQGVMIRRLGTAGPALADESMAAALRAHVAQVSAWLDRQPNFTLLPIKYGDLLRNPDGAAEAVCQFVGVSLDTRAMALQVDISLHRQRAGHMV